MRFKRFCLVGILFCRCFFSALIKFLFEFSALVHSISQWYLNVTFLLPHLSRSYVVGPKQCKILSLLCLNTCLYNGLLFTSFQKLLLESRHF